MPKQRTTVTLDERVLRAVRVKVARSGRRYSEVIEEALRRDLGLELLERIWAKADLREDEALSLAVEEQHTPAAASATRARRQCPHLGAACAYGNADASTR